MGERNQEGPSAEAMEDLFEPMLGDLSEDEFDNIEPVVSTRQRLAEKRRRAEQRLEEKRLRDELGYYDLELELDDL